MLSLYKLEIFNIVAQEGSFSKAASRLLLTQPAVSQHIRDLETSLGVELFLRGNRGVLLTSSGQALMEYTRRILKLLAEAEIAVREAGGIESNHLSVGATPGMAVYLLPEWIQDIQKRFPGLNVSLKTETTRGIAQSLLSKNLELGFVEGEIVLKPPLQALALQEIPLFIIIGSGSPLWDLKTVPIAELARQPFIARPVGSQTRAWTDQIFNKLNIAPPIVSEFDHPETIKQAVASGLGITILPIWGIADQPAGRLKALEVEGFKLRRELKLLWNEDVPFKPAARLFLSRLAERFPVLAPLTSAVTAGESQILGTKNIRPDLDESEMNDDLR